jgi:CRISPR-associated protein Cpf1
MSKKIFEEFTNRYELSKTLRFELKPVGETTKMLKENKVFDIDENIKKKYEATKPFFDRLHRKFVKEAISRLT